MIVLGIETSCDETSVSIVKNGKDILSNVVYSSIKFHKKYGGVIPEIASRVHSEVIDRVTEKALLDAHLKFKDVDLIAVTKGPGLIGSLLTGISFAKALALSLKRPLIGVNHLEAHLYANFLNNDLKRFPFIGLVISGGHSSIFFVKNWLNFQLLGVTLDDAVGEAFDKVAKILNLGYPGGPIIERLARESVGGEKIKFSCADFKDTFDFSFSGIKTDVLYKTQDKKLKVKKEDICFAFQKTVTDVIVKKAIMACIKRKIHVLLVGGGVAANSYLRNELIKESKKNNIKVFFPDRSLCLDNAAMIAGLGYQLYKKGLKSNLRLTPN